MLLVQAATTRRPQTLFVPKKSEGRTLFCVDNGEERIAASVNYLSGDDTGGMNSYAAMATKAQQPDGKNSACNGTELTVSCLKRISGLAIVSPNGETKPAANIVDWNKECQPEIDKRAWAFRPH